MDFNHDELRRQLRESEREHRAALRPWRDVLARLFPGDRSPDAAGVEAKAAALGVPAPGRRQFFKIGGMTIAGAAILAACGDDDGVALTGTTERESTTTTAGEATSTTGVAAAPMDIVLLRSASSLEVLAVNAYQAAIDSGLVTTPAVASAATLFQRQHQDHASQLQAATTDAGGQPYTQANPYVQTNVVDPALPALRTETDVVNFALTLETAAAETYAFAVGVLSTPELRAALAAIAGVEARHMAVLRGVLGQPPVPAAFLPTTDRAPDAALITS